MPLRNVRRIAAVNGFSIVIVAGLGTLASLPFSPGWAGALTGVLVTASAVAEVRGYYLLRQGDIEGIRWAMNSQIGVFLSIAGYSIYQLLQLTSEEIMALLSPEMREQLVVLLQVDEWMLPDLLLLTARMTYLALIVASFVYQGGLFLYYWWKWRKLSTSG